MNKLSPHAKYATAVGIIAVFTGVSTSAQTVFNEGFDVDFGSPIHTTTGTGFEVDVNTASSPFASPSLRVFDNTTANGPSIEWELDTAVSAAKISFGYHFSSIDTTVGQIIFGVGLKSGNTSRVMNSNANRLVTWAVSSSGTANYAAQGNISRLLNNPLDLDTVGTMTIVINDFDSQSVNYIAPDGSTQSLSANSVAFYKGNDLWHSTAFSGTIGGNDLTITEGNIGRIGINGLGSPAGISAHFDDLTVTAVPEPSTYALLLGAIAIGLAVLRRRNS